ncbi:MAG: helix-hairpin-helix domain-containing protein [Agarilytica sp.]
MKHCPSAVRAFIQKDLFSTFLVVALSFFVLASPLSMAAEKSNKKHAAEQRVDSKVNINRAGIPELTQLTGIGEQKAIAIVKYRNANGKFKRVEQLSQVKGIGEKIIDKNRKRIVL